MLVYSHHYRGKNSKTAGVFALGKEYGALPKMYLLAQLTCTKTEAFRHCVAWSKYFLEYGLSPLTEEMNRYIESFDEKTDAVYSAIRDTPLDEICGEGKDLFPNYGQKTKRNELSSGQTVLTVVVTPAEYERIKAEADAEKMTVSRYCRQLIMHHYTVKVDVGFFSKYINTLRDYIGLVEGIVTTILVSGTYYPADLDNISANLEKARADMRELKQVMIRLLRQVQRMKK